jgi:SAM-dependent methyltransferase
VTSPIGLAPGASYQAAGQDAAKYGTSNPVVRRLLDRWTGRLRQLIEPVAGVVVDVGIGEGLCAERVLAPASHGDGPVIVGVEYRFDKASVARRLPIAGVTVGDAGMLPLRDGVGDVVLCIEVLEHLPRVPPAVTELARITRGTCVVSVPWEPWFRLGNLGRGKNLARFGNDPEHLHWFGPSRLRRTLLTSFGEVDVVRVFPWLVAIARHPVTSANRPGAPRT